MAHRNGINHAWKEETVSYAIQAVTRRGNTGRRATNGSLLKARLGRKTGRSHKPLSEISVDFTGTELFNDPKTVFYLEKSVEEGANLLRYTVNGDNYYLAVNKPGKVILKKLVHAPKNKKYFFRVRTIGLEFESPFTFKSLKTGEYLHCDENGRAFMEKVTSNGEPKDRQTWFSLISRKRTPVIKHEENMMFAAKGRDQEDGNSEDSRRGSSEILKPDKDYNERPELTVYVTAV